jgi:hypothetical protein
MIVGFTGTRHPLPDEQHTALCELVTRLNCGWSIVEAHHGDCVGADALFDLCCSNLGIVRHAHPGPGKHRAFCPADVVHPTRLYMERNRDIVRAADLLIACPRGPEVRRSGTWATVRHARFYGVPVTFIWPNGIIEP